MPALAAPGGSRHAVIRKSHLPIHRYAGFQARQDEFFFTKCAHPLCIFLHQRAGQPLKTVLASHSQSQQHYIPAFRIIECDIRKEFVPKLFFLRGKSVQDRCRPTCLPINRNQKQLRVPPQYAPSCAPLSRLHSEGSTHAPLPQRHRFPPDEYSGSQISYLSHPSKLPFLNSPFVLPFFSFSVHLSSTITDLCSANKFFLIVFCFRLCYNTTIISRNAAPAGADHLYLFRKGRCSSCILLMEKKKLHSPNVFKKLPQSQRKNSKSCYVNSTFLHHSI